MNNQNSKRSYFTNTEDKMLLNLYNIFNSKWKLIAEIIGTKTPRQCRDRWIQYLSRLNKDYLFSNEEIAQLNKLVYENGHNWKIISIAMGRTGNQVKNAWKKNMKRIITY